MTVFNLGDRFIYKREGSTLSGRSGTVIGSAPGTGYFRVRLDGYDYTYSLDDSGLVDYESDWHDIPLTTTVPYSASPTDPPGFAHLVRKVLDQVQETLIAKNESYGDAALNPIRTFSKADAVEQLKVRIDDKLSRIQRGTEYGDEDTELDLIGYLVLLRIAKERLQ